MSHIRKGRQSTQQAEHTAGRAHSRAPMLWSQSPLCVLNSPLVGTCLLCTQHLGSLWETRVRSTCPPRASHIHNIGQSLLMVTGQEPCQLFLGIGIALVGTGHSGPLQGSGRGHHHPLATDTYGDFRCACGHTLGSQMHVSCISKQTWEELWMVRQRLI